MGTCNCVHVWLHVRVIVHVCTLVIGRTWTRGVVLHLYTCDCMYVCVSVRVYVCTVLHCRNEPNYFRVRSFKQKQK